MPEVGTDFVIERAHRVGRPRSDSKPRKIVARFVNYKDRITTSRRFKCVFQKWA